MEKVLFAASECTPFIKTGGLADVVGSLPQALHAVGQEVRVILPYYEEIPDKWKDQFEFKTQFSVYVGWREHEAFLFEFKKDNITYYFIKNDYYFRRKGLYGYFDDGERFVFFSQAVIEALPLLDYEVDILHAHDWQAALVLSFAKINPEYQHLKTVITIHNIRYQGWMTQDAFGDLIALPLAHFGGFEWHGMINCLKSGIFHADKITTVSPSYAEEIKDPFFGEGLHPILIERSHDLLGIINGIDTDDYNPAKDTALVANYKFSRAKKNANKTALQKELGLPVNKDIPMYICISRFVEQKGFHLLEHILYEFLQNDVQVVILGTGEPQFEHSFSQIAHHIPAKMKTLLTFDEELARRMYASADFFIMPSQFEPCGLSQLISLQYRTVPIVRETGGLKDTVIPYNIFEKTGTGFSFTNYNAHDLLSTLRYSLSIYDQEEHWNQLLKNINKTNFSWKKSAEAYKELYHYL